MTASSFQELLINGDGGAFVLESGVALDVTQINVNQGRSSGLPTSLAAQLCL